LTKIGHLNVIKFFKFNKFLDLTELVENGLDKNPEFDNILSKSKYGDVINMGTNNSANNKPKSTYTI